MYEQLALISPLKQKMEEVEHKMDLLLQRVQAGGDTHEKKSQAKESPETSGATVAG